MQTTGNLWSLPCSGILGQICYPNQAQELTTAISFIIYLATPLNEFYSSLPIAISLFQPSEEFRDEIFGLLLDIVLWEPLCHDVGDLKLRILITDANTNTDTDFD